MFDDAILGPIVTIDEERLVRSRELLAMSEMPRSLKAMLSSSVDFAGLFPPAGLGMAETLERFARYRQGSESWMLGRLVLPLSRLRELEPLAESHLSQLASWPVTLLLPKDAGAHLAELVAALERWRGRVAVTSLEVPPLDSPAAVAALSPLLPSGLERYFELDWEADPTEYLAAIRQAGAAGKLRAGGVRPELVPDPGRLAERVSACLRAGVAFKATAGLHHPLRGAYPLTYAPDSPSGPMHGFVNLSLLAALLFAGKLGPERAVELLEDEAAGSFRFGETGAGWREVEVEVRDLDACRACFFRSFGSCSFEEPAAALPGLCAS
jgi:hypothetical protein